MNYEVFRYRDEVGNSLLCGNEGSLTIQLASGESRNIGRVEQVGESYHYVKSEKANGIFRKNNSWSVPWFILSKLGDMGVVKFIYDNKIYSISANDAKKHGDFLWFKTSGIEKKIYIPLNFWKIEAIQ